MDHPRPFLDQQEKDRLRTHAQELLTTAIAIIAHAQEAIARARQLVTHSRTLRELKDEAARERQA